jgi:disulfide bond formation protein DsbB
MKHKIILNLIMLFCIFALMAAYFIQYVMDHQPCNLCLFERIPFMTAIIIILCSFLFNQFEKIFFIILSLIFFLGSLLSFYHFGVEQGFITESLVCDLSIENNILTKEALLNELKSKTVSCKDVTFKILGLSLANINIFISLILSVITLKLFLNYEKN